MVNQKTPEIRISLHDKEEKIIPRKFDTVLLLWGTITSVLSLLAFLLNGGPDMNILFAYVILVAVVVGALGSTIYIAVRSRAVK
jgi:hypothetical protein